MNENNELRGRIVSKYRTLDNFAKTLGWSHRKVSYIVGGRQEPTAADIEQMCEALAVELPEDFKSLFLKKSPQNVD